MPVDRWRVIGTRPRPSGDAYLVRGKLREPSIACSKVQRTAFPLFRVCCYWCFSRWLATESKVTSPCPFCGKERTEVTGHA